MTGEAASLRASGKDIHLLIADRNLNLLHESFHGREKDEVGHCILQARNGSYVIGGYTESEAKGYRGKKDGLILLVNETGQKVLKDILIGSAGDDQIFDVAEDAEGNLLFTGEKEGNLWLVKMDIDGNILWEKDYPANEAEVGKGIIVSDGQIAITGSSSKKKTDYVLFFIADAVGNKLLKKSFEKGKGNDILPDGEGNYLIAGVSEDNQQDGLVLKTNSAGAIIWQKKSGGRGQDGFTGIAKGISGNYYLTGYNSSFARRAARNKAWLAEIDGEGYFVDGSEEILGSSQEDSGQDIICLDDGTSIMAGYTAAKKGAWLVKYLKETPPPPSGLASLATGAIRFADNGNEILEPLERAYVEVEVQNPGSSDIFNLEADVRLVGPVSGIAYLPKILVGHLPGGKTKHIYLPVAGNQNLGNGQAQFELSFNTPWQTKLAPKLFSVYCQASGVPNLEIFDSRFNLENYQASGGKEKISLQLKVRNTGNRAAKDAGVNFIHDYAIQSAMSGTYYLGDLQPGMVASVEFKFLPDKAYQSDSIRIKCWVAEKSAQQSVEEVFSLKLEDDFSEENSFTGNTMGGPFIVADWLSPNPDEAGSIEFLSKKEKYPFKIKVISGQPIEEGQFQIKVNNNIAEKGSTVEGLKMMSAAGNSVSKSYTYTFSGTVNLEPGANRILGVIQARDGREAVTRNHIDVYYSSKVNLHIYAIGVPDYSNDLLYPPKDAEDFANAFRRQEGKLYDKVIVNIRNKEENTTAQAIKDLFVEIKQNYGWEILPEDVLVIFISCHGLTDRTGEKFGVVPSDFDLFYEDSRLINYKEDIQDIIDPLNCKKIVFIDACLSGIANNTDPGNKSFRMDQDLSGALLDLIKAKKGTRVIASCGRQERSYEDEKWENGAFTEAILEAFENKEAAVSRREKTSADSNADDILYFSELCNFLRLRVPYMVQADKPGAQTSQVPHFDETYLSEVLPILFLRK